MDVYEVWDMRCPECGADDCLDIGVVIQTLARLTPDGTITEDDNHEWDSDSPCSCDACGWSGDVSDAKVSK